MANEHDFCVCVCTKCQAKYRAWIFKVFGIPKPEQKNIKLPIKPKKPTLTKVELKTLNNWLKHMTLSTGYAKYEDSYDFDQIPKLVRKLIRAVRIDK